LLWVIAQLANSDRVRGLREEWGNHRPRSVESRSWSRVGSHTLGRWKTLAVQRRRRNGPVPWHDGVGGADSAHRSALNLAAGVLRG